MRQDHTPRPDDRSDNAEKLQQHIQNTVENIEAAEETLQKGDVDDRDRQAVESKKRRREDAIEGMRKEIIDEAHDH